MRSAAVLLVAVLTLATSPASPDLFSSYAIVELTLEAPLSDLFAQQEDDDAAVDGKLSYRAPDGGQVVVDHVEVSERGNTSRQQNECRFPKLKLRFAAGRADASIFQHMDVVKIGTHCGESPDQTLTKKYGRVANEHTTHREAFVYRLLDILGIPSLRARPARITYRDTSTGGTTIGPITRDAMLLEDEPQAMKRLNASKAIPMERFRSAKEAFSVADTTGVAFAEALIGNFDWCLRFAPGDRYRCDARKPLWNLLAFERSGGSSVPLMYDFDLSGMVTGHHSWFDTIFNDAFVESRAEPAVEVAAQLQHTRSLFSRAELDAARRRFASKKADVYRALDEAPVDARGKKQIASYLDPFFAAMKDDEAFYLPVVVRERTQAFVDAAGTRDACTAGPLPVGTPVGASIARKGSMEQVVVLDALWRFTGRSKCAAILKGPVWVDGKAIGSDYP
jgi:hypothetical protein